MGERDRRPFKVCDSQRLKIKGIVVNSLAQLKEKACLKLGVSAAKSRVFLESDGTEIDDEDYFSFLEDQTKLMIVADGEEWNAGSERYNQLGFRSLAGSLEANESLELDGTDAGDITNVISPELLIRVKQDPAFFVSFSDEHLQQVVDVETEALAAGLGRSKPEAKHCQDACQQELDRRTQLREATQLLKLYDMAWRHKDCEKEVTNKRQRTET